MGWGTEGEGNWVAELWHRVCSQPVPAGCGVCKAQPQVLQIPLLILQCLRRIKAQEHPRLQTSPRPPSAPGGFGAARLGPLGAGATPRGRGAAALVGLTQSRSSALPSSPGSCSDLVYLSCAQCKRCQQRAEINSRAFGRRGRQAQRRGEENPVG